MRSILDLLCFKQRRKDEGLVLAPIWHSGSKGDKMTLPPKRGRYFQFKELQKCTDNFSKTNEIGESVYGKVFCFILNGFRFIKVVVQMGSLLPYIDLKKDPHLTTLRDSKLKLRCYLPHHKSIVSILGFCFERGEKLLVREYISKGKLRDNLDGNGGMYLDWEKRLQIALDSARGLAYLHEQHIVHCDINTVNILLDENLNAKITDFGFARWVDMHVSSQVTGTTARQESGCTEILRRDAPEFYLLGGRFSKKSDVYNFGMVMLELLTGRHVYEFGTDGNTFLDEKVEGAIDENERKHYGLRDIIDPQIVNQVKNVGLRKFVQLAMKCLKYSASDRPSMSEAMREIEIVLELDGSEETTAVDHSADFGYISGEMA
ncbi:Leucine-rich repeat protein kinase family protein [Rhynchospora pubera]|uniref:non-specific serine/threonine protein kinase n=1 Tax=Rhynchospora pubera TaxID=906938 RepID=A0AAV8GZ43_9POAL|nr:Leucine-rich repeat protein kinase family protein [Rhynchospora pubera]